MVQDFKQTGQWLTQEPAVPFSESEFFAQLSATDSAGDTETIQIKQSHL